MMAGMFAVTVVEDICDTLAEAIFTWQIRRGAITML